MRVALDSNVLIYAEIEPETAKGARARELILRAAEDGVIPAQALGEFLRFVQRRAPAALAGAVRQVALYRAAFVTPPTTDQIVADAAALAEAHRLQIWDCVIAAAASASGAKALLTEDLQDGRSLDGLLIVNPFNAANNERIDALISSGLRSR